jgi:flagellar basal body P-ring formation protein FlgA
MIDEGRRMMDGKRTLLLVALVLVTLGTWLVHGVPVRASEEVANLKGQVSSGKGQEPSLQTSPTTLQVHLPREATVQGSLLTLGQVSVIRGEAELVAAAGSIGLGQLSIPGQRAVLDRPTILSRLASHGIPADQVRLTGAETVAVRRFHRVLGSDEFVEVGRTFLRQHPPGPGIAEMIPTVKPKDLVLSGDVQDLQMVPRFVRSGLRGLVAVQIAVLADGQEVGTRDLSFRLKYQTRRVVATAEIDEGTVLTPENVKIETVVSDQPEPAGWRPPYGLVAVRKLAENTELRPDMVVSAQPPLVIRRNETVFIRIERPGLTVTAVGRTLQEGRAGEYVKVRNTDSNRVIVCKVNPDGTVEPML